jgi:hypothetical protein
MKLASAYNNWDTALQSRNNYEEGHRQIPEGDRNRFKALAKYRKAATLNATLGPKQTQSAVTCNNLQFGPTRDKNDLKSCWPKPKHFSATT